MSEYQRQDPEFGYDLGSTAERAPGARRESPAEIEREIENTRDRMSHTIDALGEKLSPRNLKEQAKEAISSAARDTANAVGDKARYASRRVAGVARDNAIPITLVGAGVTWLLLKNRSHRGYTDTGGRYGNGDREWERRTAYQASYDYGAPGVSERDTEARGGVRGAASSAVSNVKETVSDAADTVKESVSEAATSVKQKTGELARRAGEVGVEAGHRAQDVGRRAKGTFERTLEENPLAIAAGAAALGVVLGLLFPATSKEDELMGPARDRLVDTTKETARVVKDVAAETVRTEANERAPELKAAAREVTDTVKGAVAQVAEESKLAAKETIRSRRHKS